MTDADKPATVVAASQDLKRRGEAHLRLDADGLAAAEQAAAAFMESFSADRAEIVQTVTESFATLVTSGTNAAGAADRLIADFRRVQAIGEQYGDGAMVAVARSLLGFLEGRELSRQSIYAVNLHVDALSEVIQQDWRDIGHAAAGAMLDKLAAAVEKAR